MATDTVQRIEADGATLHRIIDQKILPTLEGEEQGHAILALITLATMLMKPNGTLEEWQGCVRSTTEHMSLMLGEAYSDLTPEIEGSETIQ